MTPLFFEGRFGWLHEPAGPTVTMGDPARALGVVLCPAFAQEEVCTHHGMMELAERLAAAGLPTLRFDYRGTGDSADVAVSVATMVEDVARAVDCLRQQTGVSAVALCGVRLGAALAALATADLAGIAGVALLAPVISGQAFLRETRASASVASLSKLDPVPKADAGLPLNTNGFHWSAALQADVAAIDLGSASLRIPHAFLAIARTDRRAAAFTAAVRDAGGSVTDCAFADYDGFMQDPTTHKTPYATFAMVEAWLCTLSRAVGDVPAAAAVAITDTLEIEGCRETPIRFGSGDAVFGMLCAPSERAAAPVAALLLHEGSTHHIGNGRAYVALARQLARAGIASLRMDLSGMGDSPAFGNGRNPHYDPERQGEVRAAMDWLAHAGFGKGVAFGLCSGAHTALQASIADTRIVGSVVVNLQKFVWNYGDDIRVAVRNNKRTLRSYIRSMRNPGEWRRALTGQADLVGVARVLAKRGIARAGHAVRSLLPPAAGSPLAVVREQMQAMTARRVHTVLLFSDEDPGLSDVWVHFGRAGRRLAAYAPARLVMLERADHHFNGSEARTRYYAIAEAAMHAAIADHASDMALVEPAVSPVVREADRARRRA